MQAFKENHSREPMNQCSMGEVPASPEMQPLHPRESPGSTTPTTPTSTISTDMNNYAVTKVTTTGPSMAKWRNPSSYWSTPVCRQAGFGKPNLSNHRNHKPSQMAKSKVRLEMRHAPGT